MKLFAVALSLLVAGIPSLVFAQANVNDVKKTELDISIPESPGFAVLGLSPQKVLRPGSVRQLATTLLNGVDDNGNFQSGVALDTAPALLLFGNGIQLDEYRNNYLIRLAARTQLSFATTKGASEADKSSRLGLGVRLTLFDLGDARSDDALAACLVRAAEAAMGPPVPPPPAGESQEQTDARVAEANKLREAAAGKAGAPCRDAWAKDRWNRSAWTAGWGTSWTSTTGQSRDLDSSGGSIWTSLGYGFEGVKGLRRTSQIIGHYRRHYGQRVKDPQVAAGFRTQNANLIGGKMRVGSATFAGSFEGVYYSVKPANGAKEEFARLTAGVEKRLSDNFWLMVSVGGESGQRDGRNQLLILSGLKWSFTEGPSAGPK